MKNWELIKSKDNIAFYNSTKWLCEDGDYAVMYIINPDKDNTEVEVKIELYFLSGIEASSFIVNSLDFGYFYRKLHINGKDKDRYLKIADYICSLFCEST